MAIQCFCDGNVLYGCEINNLQTEIVTYQLVNAGQAAINAIKGGGDINAYSLMTVDYFSDVSGCFNTLESYSAPFNTNNYTLQKVEYVDSFTADGCSTTTLPTCLNSFCICRIGTIACDCFFEACNSGGLLNVCSGFCQACYSGNGQNCLYILTPNMQLNSDCYVLDLCCMCGNSSGDSANCIITRVTLGNKNLHCYCCSRASGGGTYALTNSCFEAQKIAGTNCYNLLCNGVSICCDTVTFTNNAWEINIWSDTDGDPILFNSKIILKDLNASATSSYLTTNLISKSYSPKYVVVTNLETEGATNPGEIVYDLLCCDDTVACCGLSLNTPYDINAVGECCYKLRFCNNCCYCNVQSDGTCMYGYAVQFIE